MTSRRRITVTFTVVYETDAPDDFDADAATWQLFDHCPRSFALEDPVDPLMNDAFDMEAIGWAVETAEWGDMRAGVLMMSEPKQHEFVQSPRNPVETDCDVCGIMRGLHN